MIRILGDEHIKVTVYFTDGTSIAIEPAVSLMQITNQDKDNYYGCYWVGKFKTPAQSGHTVYKFPLANIMRIEEDITYGD